MKSLFKFGIIKAIGAIIYLRSKYLSLIAYYQKKNFAQYGENVKIGHYCNFTLNHIYCGSNVSIGNRASFIASIANIYIGNYVMFGPNVTIRGGNHRTDLVGRYMITVKDVEKLPENDKDVIIEDDVWVGCNVTILKGVIISKGTIVAAGSVVTKSFPPYSIIGGNPAKLIKMRFSEEEIIEHNNIIESI